jgi:hypothetical protein
MCRLLSLLFGGSGPKLGLLWAQGRRATIFWGKKISRRCHRHESDYEQANWCFFRAFLFFLCLALSVVQIWRKTEEKLLHNNKPSRTENVLSRKASTFWTRPSIGWASDGWLQPSNCVTCGSFNEARRRATRRKSSASPRLVVSIFRQIASMRIPSGRECRPVTRMTTVRQRPDGPKQSLDISFISRQTRPEFSRFSLPLCLYLSGFSDHI